MRYVKVRLDNIEDDGLSQIISVDGLLVIDIIIKRGLMITYMIMLVLHEYLHGDIRLERIESNLEPLSKLEEEVIVREKTAEMLIEEPAKAKEIVLSIFNEIGIPRFCTSADSFEIAERMALESLNELKDVLEECNKTGNISEEYAFYFEQ